jgi:hypothetical protein
VNWLDKVSPGTATGVSFGVPWPKGAVKRGQAVELKTADGKTLPVQTWPLAYWPDGSLKWSGIATVAGADGEGALKVTTSEAAAGAAEGAATGDGRAGGPGAGSGEDRRPAPGGRRLARLAAVRRCGSISTRGRRACGWCTRSSTTAMSSRSSSAAWASNSACRCARKCKTGTCVSPARRRPLGGADPADGRPRRPGRVASGWQRQRVPRDQLAGQTGAESRGVTASRTAAAGGLGGVGFVQARRRPTPTASRSSSAPTRRARGFRRGRGGGRRGWCSSATPAAGSG